jgi:tellurite resistance protein TerC
LSVSWWVWVVFSLAVVAVLLLDLAVFHRRAQEVTLREAAAWTVVWLVLAVGFAPIVWVWLGGAAAKEYLAGYLIERSLSIDNVFVLVVIFAYFAVPPEYRHRALLWGVIGALGLRLVFIGAGAVALEKLSWAVYVLGAFLVLTGLRLAVRELHVDPEENPVLRLLRRLLPMTADYHGQRFFVRVERQLRATPMLAVLVAVATTDVAFAADSVPAVFAVTDDPFLVFAANAFAVLGMLALFFLLAATVHRFRFLRPALAAILVFVGVKMAASHMVEIPISLSLAVIGAIIGLAALASLADARRSRVPVEAVRPARPAELETTWR